QSEERSDSSGNRLSHCLLPVEYRGQGYACTLRQATTRRALIFLSSGAENKKPRRTGAFGSGVTTLSAGALSDLGLARELACERFPFGTRVMGVVLGLERRRVEAARREVRARGALHRGEALARGVVRHAEAAR